MASRQEIANAIRVLAMDAVQKAKSGHPGMPMGMADIAEVLWRDFLQHSPENPEWWNRDRFVVSNGHGSMLLYALLHLTGYDLSIDDIKAFRQLDSKTPGHPEHGITPGVETTTGPLGQGLANAVGMAIAESMLAQQFNKPEFEIINHYTYVFAGDGCLMEGISHEACSLAGTLGLGKLIVFWDDNGISIDGKVRSWFNDNTAKRFEAYNWHVLGSVNGHDSESVSQAILEARKVKDKPTLICCRTQIGFGAPNLGGSEKAHGAPLGEDEIQATRRQLGWNSPPFIIPEEIKQAWLAVESGHERVKQWQAVWEAYHVEYPTDAKELTRRMETRLPEHWSAIVDDFLHEAMKDPKDVATRKASQVCLNHFGPKLPELVGGSADLTGSNLTKYTDQTVYSSKARGGKYIYYGVREFGMSAIMNGLALYGGFIPYGGTFLVFTDYARNAIRLSGLMKQRVIYVMTHDSIGLGEDGPTHQPIEHLSMLRATPNISVWRPADDIETITAWQKAIENKSGPTVLALSRQNLPRVQRHESSINKIVRGGYVVKDPGGEPELILIATGSEVMLAMAVAKALSHLAIRVVSMPSMDTFKAQTKQYQDEVLLPHVRKRVAIEAAASQSWYEFVGLDGLVCGIDSYGESAPYQEIYEHFGLTEKQLTAKIEKYFEKE